MKKIALSALALIFITLVTYGVYFIYFVYFYELDEESKAYIAEKDPHKKMSLLKATMDEDSYNRWVSLDEAAELAYKIKDYEGAKKYALESLSLSSSHISDWNYGNSIHNSNMILGRISLRNGDFNEAKKYLLASAKSPGSPQLDTFGPSLKLADELLQNNESTAVLSYLHSISRFWEMDNGCIERFISQIENNEKPKLYNCSCRSKKIK